MMEELRGKSLAELEAIVQRLGFPGYRAKQVFQWLYKHGVRELNEMSNVPKELRETLADRYRAGGVEIAGTQTAHDGTRKILFRLEDGRHIEGVVMPEKGRITLCISSQVGCSLACRFCLTGMRGFQRNLSVAEIVDQVVAVQRELLGGQRPNNLVFMGMGEPLLNLDGIIPALRLLTSPQAVGISTRRITVSTVGIVPGIRALGEAQTGVNLAVSLNASTDEVRTRLMPINAQYPLAAVMEACRQFPLTNRRRITFEYVLLSGVNDSVDDARRLVTLVHGIPCKINLIPFNPCQSIPYAAPPADVIEEFRTILAAKHFTVAVRYSKGGEIQAACGQLAGHYLAQQGFDE
jgi:23S rRNA (adenine2503-C2)-methyltransferase